VKPFQINSESIVCTTYDAHIPAKSRKKTALPHSGRTPLIEERAAESASLLAARLPDLALRPLGYEGKSQRENDQLPTTTINIIGALSNAFLTRFVACLLENQHNTSTMVAAAPSLRLPAF
jgi:hypothetical protein